MSRDVIFDETEMPLKRNVDATATFELDSPESYDGDPTDPESDGESDDVGSSDQGGAAHQQQTEQQQPKQPTRDRPRRNAKLPARFSYYDMCFFALCVAEMMVYSEPATYEDSIRGKEMEKWLSAMREEIESLLENRTWILVKNAGTQKLVSCKWIFKKKMEMGDAETIRFKVRLVARGFTQVEGVDFTEVLSPVVKHTSIRILLALTAFHDWELHQLDVKTTFLHRDLEEAIYMVQPKGFVKAGDSRKCAYSRKVCMGSNRVVGGGT